MGCFLGLIAFALYCWLIYLFFEHVFFWAALGGAVLITGWALVNFIRAVVRCCKKELPAARNDGPVGSEPAYRQYFFRRAYMDLWDIVVQNYHHDRDMVIKLYEWGSVLVEGWIFTWPLLVVFISTGLSGLVAALAVNLAFVLIYAVFLLLAMIVNLILMGGVRGIEMVVLAGRRFVNNCPKCYEHFALPEYECTCGAIHNKLVPGSYGIFRRRCECGKHLPTSYLLGRHRLTSYCPSCHKLLEGEDPNLTPVLLPVIAGRSAGKSTFQVGLLIGLFDRQRRGRGKVSFIVNNDHKEFRIARKLFNKGEQLPQTLAKIPEALQLSYQPKDMSTGKKGRRFRVFMYDAAGEAFREEEHVEQLRFIDHCNGLTLIIDPFSIRAVQERFAREISLNVTDVGASDDDPEDTYERLVGFLERHRLRRGMKKVKIPLAVLVTKRDAFGLQNEIGPLAVAKAQEKEDKAAALVPREAKRIELTDVVRDWLCRNGLAGLVNNFEGQFETCRYFSCSALGRLPSRDKGKPFVPEDAMLPFDWFFENSRIK